MPACRTVATPSANGVCAITAAIRGSPPATATTCPPDSEVPQSATRVGSTPSRPAPEADRRPPVVVLAGNREQLPRLAGRLAEVAVVEHQGRDPGVAESLRIGPEPALVGPAEAVREDHQRVRARLAFRRVVPGRAALAAGVEAELPWLLPKSLNHVVLAGSTDRRRQRIGRVVVRLPAELLAGTARSPSAPAPEGRPARRTPPVRRARAEARRRAGRASCAGSGTDSQPSPRAIPRSSPFPGAARL